MKELTKTRNRIIKSAAVIGLIVCGVSVFFKPHFALGAAIGTMVSIVNFILLEKQVLSFAHLNKSAVFVFFGYIIRYLFIGAALFLAAKWNIVVFFGMAVGLFAIRIGIYKEELSKK